MYSRATCLLVFCALLTIVQAQPAWLTNLVAWSGPQGAYKSDAYTTNAYEFAEFMGDGWDKALYDPTWDRLYAQANQISFFDSQGQPQSSGIPAKNVRDFTVSLTGQVLYVTSEGELWRYEPTSQNVSLLVADESVKHVTTDETTGRIYFSSNQTVYSMAEDGTGRVTEFSVQSITIPCDGGYLTGYLHVYNGTVYPPTICGNAMYIYPVVSGYVRPQTLCSSCPEGKVTNMFMGEEFLIWDDGTNASRVATFTMDESNGFQLEQKWTTSVTNGASWTIVGALSEGEERAHALKYCYLSGRFNGTDCECNPTAFGEMCEKYCNSDDPDNCMHGHCTSEGLCECPLGYRSNGLRCLEMIPTNPPVYATIFEQQTTNAPMGTNSSHWNYFSKDSEQTIVIRGLFPTDSSIYQIADYQSSWLLSANETDCVQVPLTSSWPGGPLPPDSVYVRTTNCPRNSNIHCDVWSSPDENHWFWTSWSAFLGRDAMYQEEIRLPHETIFRYYSLDHTTASPPENWNNSSSCPCWSSLSCPSLTPPMRPETATRTSSRTPSPTQSPTRTPSQTPSVSYTSSISTSPTQNPSTTPSPSPSASSISPASPWRWLWITLSIFGVLVVVGAVGSILALLYVRKRQQFAYVE